MQIEMAARRCYGTEEAIAFALEPGSDSEMSDLENSDDKTDEVYIPPERENESDFDEVSDESYSCQSIDQNKDNKNDNDENSNTEKLGDGQNGDKSKIHQPTTVLQKKCLDQRSKRNILTISSVGERRNHQLVIQSFVGINSAILQSIFMKCVQLIFSSYSGPATLHKLL